jgi:hypothetical protein
VAAAAAATGIATSAAALGGPAGPSLADSAHPAAAIAVHAPVTDGHQRTATPGRKRGTGHAHLTVRQQPRRAGHAGQGAAGQHPAQAQRPAHAEHQAGAGQQGHPAKAQHPGRAQRPGKAGHPALAHHRAASHRAVRHAAARRLSHPWRMYDSVTPGAIPDRQAAAVYSTGRYFATPGQLGRLGHSIWIDVTGYDYEASALDVEPGDATPSQAAAWAYHRLRAHPHSVARLYTMQSEWGAVKAAVADLLPGWMHARVHYWIADPTGVPHILPGSAATQWYWGQNYDISSANPGF